MSLVLRWMWSAVAIASIALAAPSFAASTTLALNHNYYNVIAPTFDGSSGDLSYIRLSNGGTATTTFSVTVVGSPSGHVYGMADFSVPAGASLQYALPTILTAASAGPLAGGDTNYSLYMQDADSSLSYQHVIYNAATSSFSNVSLCHQDSSIDYAALNASLTNVHTSRIAGYPSQIYVHNAATSAATYDVSVADAGTGTVIGTVPLTIAANATYTAPFSWFQSQLQWTPTADQPHANITFAPRSPATFQIEVGNFVTNQQTSISVNLTERCGFIGSSAARTAYVGTFAGASMQSGTFAMTVQAPMATQAALPVPKNFAVEKSAAVTSASATVLVSGGGTVTVAGDFDPATNAVTLAGNGFAFTGTVAGGVYSGTYTAPNGNGGNFSALLGTQHSVTAYCGTYSEPRPPGEQFTTAGGVFNLQIAADGTISGDTSSTFGGGQHIGVFTGHAEGNTAYVTHSSTGKDPPDVDNVIGHIQNGTISGTYPSAGGTGTFTGSVCSVPQA